MQGSTKRYQCMQTNADLGDAGAASEAGTNADADGGGSAAIACSRTGEHPCLKLLYQNYTREHTQQKTEPTGKRDIVRIREQGLAAVR